jgi:cytochrome c oxidase subunit 3
MAALGLFFVILGAGQWVNGADWGKYSLFFGLILVVRLFCTNGSAMPFHESEGGPIRSQD